MSANTAWQWTKSGGKLGFDKLSTWTDKIGGLVGKSSERLGPEAFWPASLDVESEMAARILRSFCRDGFYQEATSNSSSGPRQKQGVLKRIHPKILRNARALAIFTAMRTGLWISGSGGSGIIIARLEDGTWSSPSGIMINTAQLKFIGGIDIYDCLLVINTEEALNVIANERYTMGEDFSAVAGPISYEEVTEAEQNLPPVFAYLKSRSILAEVPVDGTIIIERVDENEKFYNDRVTATTLLSSPPRNLGFEIRKLLETIRSAEGEDGINITLLPLDAPPSDFHVEEHEHVFGVPDKEDPDPFGVLALEKQGFEIREAGTQKRPPSEQFDFKPSPTSPIYTTFSRQSTDKRRSFDFKSITSPITSPRSSWRFSMTSNAPSIAPSLVQSPIERLAPMVDMSTQTDFVESPRTEGPNTADLIHNPDKKRGGLKQPVLPVTEETNENITDDETPVKAKPSVEEKPKLPARPTMPKNEVKDVETDSQHSLSDDEEEIEEEPEIEEPVVVASVHQAAAPQVISRARLVTVAKAVPPKLPPRNPHRERKRPVSLNSQPFGSTREMVDQGTVTSPVTSLPPSSRYSPTTASRSSTYSRSSISSDEPLDMAGEEGLKSTITNLPEEPVSKHSTENFHSVPTTPIASNENGVNNIKHLSN